MTEESQNPAESDPGLDRIPVSVLTGFLGSGKTTILNRLLKHPAMGQTAVVINEFGEVGIDNFLVETASEDMVVMDSGCLCCTIRGDLIETLRDLVRRRWRGEVPKFERLMIETTGLADPAPILHTLMTDPVISARYRLDGVIATVDAANGAATLDAQIEAVKQAAVADRILLTKTDIEPDTSDLRNRLAAINPAAPVMTPIQGDVDPGALFGAGLYDPATKHPDVAGWLKEEAYQEGHGHHHGHDHHHDPNRHDDRIRSFVIRHDGAVDWDRFVDWIEAIISTHGANILRMKGILRVKDIDGPVAVHGVQHVFHPPAMLPSWDGIGETSSRIVMITRDINKDPVEKMFRAFVED